MDEERSEVLKAEEVDEMQVSGIKIDCKNKKIKKTKLSIYQILVMNAMFILDGSMLLKTASTGQEEEEGEWFEV